MHPYLENWVAIGPAVVHYEQLMQELNVGTVLSFWDLKVTVIYNHTRVIGTIHPCVKVCHSLCINGPERMQNSIVNGEVRYSLPLSPSQIEILYLDSTTLDSPRSITNA